MAEKDINGMVNDGLIVVAVLVVQAQGREALLFGQSIKLAVRCRLLADADAMDLVGLVEVPLTIDHDDKIDSLLAPGSERQIDVDGSSPHRYQPHLHTPGCRQSAQGSPCCPFMAAGYA